MELAAVTRWWGRSLFAGMTLLIGLALTPLPVSARAAPKCTFVLGFQTLHDLLPAEVGKCQDGESHDLTSGDALQHTTGGLLVWRKLDNWTAFTNGYQTWVNGPNGLAQRLNTERFSWEANPDQLPVVSDSSSAAGSGDATPLPSGTITTQNKKTVQMADLAGHTFYASSSKRARTIYCDDDPARKSLSAKRLLSFPSFAAASAALPADRLHRPC